MSIPSNPLTRTAVLSSSPADLVGDLLEMKRHVEAQQLGCLKVDNKIEIDGAAAASR